MTDRTETHRPDNAHNRLTAWWDRWDRAIVWGSMLALSALFWVSLIWAIVAWVS